MKNAALSPWAFLVVHALQVRLALFTDDVCQRIDDMMRGGGRSGDGF